MPAFRNVFLTVVKGIITKSAKSMNITLLSIHFQEAANVKIFEFVRGLARVLFGLVVLWLKMPGPFQRTSIWVVGLIEKGWQFYLTCFGAKLQTYSLWLGAKCINWLHKRGVNTNFAAVQHSSISSTSSSVILCRDWMEADWSFVQISNKQAEYFYYTFVQPL